MTVILFTSLLFITTITAFISGVFGMAGGMILMGFLIWVLPVSQAMVLHGVIQVVSNGWRSFLHRQHIQWHLIASYIFGAMLCLCVFLYLSLQISKTTAFLILGLLPFTSLILPKNLNLDITKRSHSVLCGFLVAIFQLTAGVSGPMVDLFYLNRKLNRFEITSTKACTQCLSHMIKVFYFGWFLPNMTDIGFLPLYIYGGAVVTTMIGTTVSKIYLKKMKEQHFFTWTRRILYVTGFIYLIKAGLLILE